MPIFVDPAYPIVDKDGKMETVFRLYMLEQYANSLLVGVGSPEGVIQAEQGQEYMDSTGVAGSIKYIKRDTDIAGDRSAGWILI